MVKKRLLQIIKLMLINIVVTFGLCVFALEAAYIFSHGTFFFTDFKKPKSDISFFRQSRDLERNLVQSQDLKLGFIGGSTTYGLGVEEKDTLPELLKTRLQRRHGINASVYNFGYLGAHLRQQKHDVSQLSKRLVPLRQWTEHIQKSIEREKHGVKDFELDYLVITPIVNDTVAAYFQETSFWLPLCRFQEKNIMLQRLALRYFTCRLSDTRFTTTFDPTIVRLVAQQFESRLSALITKIQAQLPETRIVLMSLPIYFSDRYDDKTMSKALEFFRQEAKPEVIGHFLLYPPLVEAESEIIGKVATNFGLEFIDLSNFFETYQKSERVQFFIDPNHTTARANRLLSKQIAGHFVRLVKDDPRQLFINLD